MKSFPRRPRRCHSKRLTISETLLVTFSTLVFTVIGISLLIAFFAPASADALGNAAAFQKMPKPPSPKEVEKDPELWNRYRTEFVNYLKLLKLLGIPT